jgi:uncharacterized protein YuzB (UPF0349 family)
MYFYILLSMFNKLWKSSFTSSFCKYTKLSKERNLDICLEHICLLLASFWLLDSLFSPEDGEVRSSETSVNIYHTIRHHIPENNALHSHCYENLKSSFTANILIQTLIYIYVYFLQYIIVIQCVPFKSNKKSLIKPGKWNENLFPLVMDSWCSVL